MYLSAFSKVMSRTAYVIASIFIAVMMLSTPANAQSLPCQLPDSTFLGLPTWYKFLEGEQDRTRVVDGGFACTPKIDYSDTEEDVNAFLPIGLAVLEGLLRLAGLVTVVMVFWASVKFLTSNGNGDAAAEARRTAINAVIGLAIVIIATSTVAYIGNRLISPTQVNTTGGGP